MSFGDAYGLAVGLLVIFNLGLLARLLAFRLNFPTLREWDGPTPASWPKVSVIVPCRNEATGVETAMSSLLAQDYPDLEIVAVDDRSEDEVATALGLSLATVKIRTFRGRRALRAAMAA